MYRNVLLRTLSVAALAAGLSPGFASAQAIMNGGGSTAAQADWAGPDNGNTPTSEMSLFNSTYTKANFGTYWGSGSGTGQQAFINDDLTCDINKVQNGGKCAGDPGGANTVHYGASDNPISSTQLSTWATSSYGQAAAGNFVQIPAFGTGPGIVVNDTNVAEGAQSNGLVELSDNDLCGIFSGLITDFSQVTDSKTLTPAPGPITLVYRADSSGTTFLLTNHLSGVCTQANTLPGVTITATTTFASLFPNGINTYIPNAVGENLSSGVADYLAAGGPNGTPVPQAIGYLSPDWTSITPNSPQLVNGAPSQLVVAAIFNGKKAYTPTTTFITTGLEHATVGQFLTNPTISNGANPLVWVPVIQVTSSGYPIVGYSTLDLAQCYADPVISAGVIEFVTDHYKKKPYLAIEANDGLVPLKKAGKTGLEKLILAHLVGNTGGTPWNINIGNATACSGLAGR
jgi:ABC-type phosphate transport system substrate-binding protein